jgi:hypothetical protein
MVSPKVESLRLQSSVSCFYSNIFILKDSSQWFEAIVVPGLETPSLFVLSNLKHDPGTFLEFGVTELIKFSILSDFVHDLAFPGEEEMGKLV